MTDPAPRPLTWMIGKESDMAALKNSKISGLSILPIVFVLWVTAWPLLAPSSDAHHTPDHAVIHYFRADGDYGDHTTGDFNDFWGLHLWGDITETIEWPNPKPFLGEDEYGRLAWVYLAQNAANVGLIVHRGDVKDGTNADRFFDPGANPEIWLRSDDATIYTSQAEAQGFVTVHYHRDDGDYGNPASPDFNDFWGLHLWGDAIDPSELTNWPDPKRTDGFDSFGAFFTILLQDATQPVNFIVHRGDQKDPASGPDRSFNPLDNPSIWLQSEDNVIYPQRGAATKLAILHYHRPAGDYGDYTSNDFNDFWGLHTWGGADNPTWPMPLKPVAFDIFGPIFHVNLFAATERIGYIFHRGDAKDPGPDQFMVFDSHGHEVWQEEGAHPDRPYILPVLLEVVDECPNNPSKTEPGICGCDLPDTDADLDGSPHCVDCNDGDGSVHPEAEELCNAVDDNCDGFIDEGCECGPHMIPCDLDADCDVDIGDLMIILMNRNLPAAASPGSDVDGDGMITVLDARRCVLACTCARCFCGGPP